MDSGGGQDHRRGKAIRRPGLVGQHDQGGPVAGGRLGLVHDAVQRGAQGRARAGVFGRQGVAAVDDHGRTGADRVDHPLIHAVGQDGAVQHEDVGLGLFLGQDVAQVLEPGLQAHGARFAQRVDGRVGDLAEVLAEIVAQRAGQGRQHGGRGVVAHRADRLLAIAHQGVQQQIQILAAVAGGDLATGQGLARGRARFGSRADDRLQIDHIVQPRLIGVGGGQSVDGLVLVIDAAMLHIDGDQLAGADVQAALHPALGDRHQTGLGARHQEAVHRLDGAQGTQAIAVLARHDPAAVGGADGGRAVPRLHHRIAIGVEGPVFGGHDHVVLGPGLGDQQGLGHRRGATGVDQHLHDIVQGRRVRSARLDHRLDLAVAVAEGAGRHADLVRLHPVQIALQRVDLAVVGHHAEGLSELPFGEGVGRITLVEDRVGRDEARVLQVGIQFAQQLGPDHPLVGDGARGQGADIDAGQVLGLDRLLDTAAAQIQFAFERLAVQRLARVVQRRGQHDLFDLGPGRAGLGPDDRQVDGRLAPAIDPEAGAQGLGLDDGAGAVLGAQVGARQEDLADADGPRTQGLADGGHLFGEEALGQLRHDAGAVARQAVGIDRAAVGHGLQAADRIFDHVAAGRAVDRADQAHTAGVPFGGAVIGVPGFQPVAGLFVFVQPVTLLGRYRPLACMSAHAATSSVRVLK